MFRKTRILTISKNLLKRNGSLFFNADARHIKDIKKSNNKDSTHNNENTVKTHDYKIDNKNYADYVEDPHNWRTD